MTPIDSAQSIQDALQHHRAGRLGEAEKLYRAVLASQPDHVDAMHLLGVLLGQTGRAQAGIELVGRACAIYPTFAELFLSFGDLLHGSGDCGRAIESYRRALQLNPQLFEAHNNLGNTLIDLHRHAEAGEAYRAALQLDPRRDRTWSNLGIVLRAAGQFDEAIAAFNKAIELDPDSAIANDNLGIVLREAGRIDASLAAHQRALELEPNSSAMLGNLSVTLRLKGRLDDALEACHRAIAADATNAEAYSNLGVTLADSGRTDEAIAASRKALELRPAFAAAWSNLGISLGDQGHFAESLVACQKAVDIEPANAMAHFNLGVILLKLGDFPRGWVEYEWRWRCAEIYHARAFAQPRWDGQPLHGQTIFLHAEQGLGDAIQFIRYVPLIRQRGGRVYLGCHAPLRNLVGGFPGVEGIFTDGQPVPAFDTHCAIGSLPALFSTTADSIPADVPYLRAKPHLAAYWREKLLPYNGQRKVGLVWAGGESHKNDKNRSTSLSCFAPLAAEGIVFFSLQKGPASAQAADPPAGLRLIDFADELFDLVDTAAFIDNLDLVISVDTAVAHLAGAMGKSVWTLLPFNADWRWLLDRDGSPWYPTMRLLRQRRAGDWDEVITRVRGALHARLMK
jgi:Flp pilus assembly protein TadD